MYGWGWEKALFFLHITSAVHNKDGKHICKNIKSLCQQEDLPKVPKA